MSAAASFKKWIVKADADFESARALSRLKKRGISDIVCYHCHQCVEKYLKAFLVLHKVAFPRSHDLMALMGLLKPKDGLIETVKDEIEFINPYSVQIRYPGDDASRSEARSVLQKAKIIRTFFRSRISRK